MPRHILLADDSVTMRKVFEMTFAGEDVRLTATANADEALLAARRDRPDLVLADAQMPGRTGYELCAAIKADAALRGVPVLILASQLQPFDESRGRSAQADGHLIKPFESQALIDKVMGILGKGRAPETAAPRASLASPTPSHPPRETALGAPTPTARPPLSAPLPSRAPPSVARPAETAGARGASGPVALPTAPPGLGRPPMIGGRPPVSSRPPSSTLRPGAGAATAPADGPQARAAEATARPPAGTRTVLGMPQPQQSFPPPRVATPVSAPPSGRVGPPPGAAPAHDASGAAFSPFAAAVHGAAVDRVAHKVAELAASGPEYAAIAKLSREIIEQIAWEVVPELAEAIIRSELERLIREKNQ